MQPHPSRRSQAPYLAPWGGMDDHDREDEQDPGRDRTRPATDGSGLTVALALAANIGITAAKLAGFLVTGSSSLLAETLHSTADSANQSLLVYGRRRARRREDPSHPFGYARERYFWALVVAFLMFGVGSVGSLLRAWSGVVDPQPLRHPGWAIGILLVALALDGSSWINAVRQAGRRRQRGWWAYVRDSRSPEIPMVLLEDTAAVIGLAVAFAAVGATMVTGNGLWDALGSGVIGLLLAVVAGVLSREMKSLLIGEPARPEEEARIHAALLDQPGIRELISLRTLYLGPEDLLVDAKVRVADELDGRQVALAIDGAERRIRARVPNVRLIAVEPDIRRDDDPDLPDWAREEPGGAVPGGAADREAPS